MATINVVLDGQGGVIGTVHNCTRDDVVALLLVRGFKHWSVISSDSENFEQFNETLSLFDPKED